MNSKISPKELFKSIFLKEKKRLEEALEFYQQVEKNLPPEEMYKITKATSIHNNFGLLASDFFKPSELIEKVILTMDEYLIALDNFTSDQFAAFILGLGINWLPFDYWGLDETHRYHEKVIDLMSFYEELEKKLSEDEMYKAVSYSPIGLPTDLIPRSEMKNSEILKKVDELTEACISILENRPF